MNTTRLLLIDDDAAVAEVAASMTQALGGQARVVTRVNDFLKALDEWAPTHIAVDLVMPQVGGVEVLNLLARRRCKARVIISSGMGGTVLDAAMRAAVGNGLDVVGVLPKPFAMRELKALLAPAPAPAAASRPPLAAALGTTREPTEAALRRALQGDEIFPVFMPTVDCTTGELIGFEANARWRHPQDGVLAANRFIPLAERLGLIDALTETIARQAFGWLGKAFRDSWLGLTLKLSVTSLGSPRLVETLVEQTAQYGLDPRRITLQLSEAAAMSETLGALELLTRLRMKGFDLSLGNFGIGYSSLIHLVWLPISEIKTDPTLFATVGDTREGRMVARCVVDLGNSLGLRVTASGIDSAESLRYFSQLGCHYAMGFFIGRPMEAAALGEWIARWQGSLGSRWQAQLHASAEAA